MQKRFWGGVIATIAVWIAMTHAGSLWAGNSVPAAYNTSLVQTGDLLFIQGRTWRGYVVLMLDHNHKDFSHVGLIQLRDGVPYLIHASPTSSAGRPDGAVQIEPLAEVLSSGTVEKAALYRLHDEYKQFAPPAVAIAENFAAHAVPFDHDFSLLSPDKLYCTELIWLAYKRAGLDLVGMTPDQSTVLLPSMLYESPYLSEITQF